MSQTIRDMLADWYWSLDAMDKAKVAQLFATGQYAQVVDEYGSSPGFPTSEMLRWAEKRGPTGERMASQ